MGARDVQDRDVKRLGMCILHFNDDNAIHVDSVDMSGNIVTYCNCSDVIDKHSLTKIRKSSLVSRLATMQYMLR